MLKYSDAADCIKAMMKEASDHESRNHWSVIPRSEKPPDVKTILAIWAFKRKRFPHGRINKHKARLCSWRNADLWGQLLGYICPNCQLDKHQISFSGGTDPGFKDTSNIFCPSFSSS